jgi:hypothetical protein
MINVDESKIFALNSKIISRSPRLDTLVMVEKFIKENSGEFKKTELFNKLPKKVMWGTFNIILNYLWDNNKIAIDREGFIVYIWNPSLAKRYSSRRDVSMSFAGSIKVIQDIKQKIIEILNKRKVVKAGIFGSYARGEQTKESDIDILIEFDGSLIDMVKIERELKDKLKKKVDLLTYNGINAHLKDRILKEEIRII